jgi:flagellar protein FliS
VLTAAPEELRLMLLDGAIKFARQGREGLAARNYEASYNGITASRDIVLELITTIKPEYDPELFERVKAVYTFIYTEMITASMEKSVPRLDRIIELLEYERETWVLLMSKLAAERASGATDAGPRAALSVQA